MGARHDGPLETAGLLVGGFEKGSNMTKDTAIWICEFISKHYDAVWQEDWFDLQDVLLDTVAHDANQGGYARAIAEKFPYFFAGEER